MYRFAKNQRGNILSKVVAHIVILVMVISSALICPIVAYADPVGPTILSIDNLLLSGLTLYAGQTLRLDAVVNKGDGNIERVEYYNNGTELLATVNAPISGSKYRYDWTNVISGSYSITAKAIDSNGLEGVSPAYPIEVSPRVKKTFVSNNFDSDDFVIDDITYPNRTTEVTGVIPNYSALRQGLDSISTAASPNLNGGSPNPGKSLRLYKEADIEEAVTATTASVKYSGPGVGGAENNGRIGGYQRIVFEADVYFGDVGNNDYKLFTLYSGTKSLELLTVRKDGRIRVGTFDTWVTPVVNKWYNFRLEFDASSWRANLYIDGVLRAGTVSTGSFDNSYNTNGISAVETSVVFSKNKGSLLYLDNFNVSLYELSPITISIVSPSGNVTVEEGESLELAAEVTDPDGDVEKVEFWSGETKIGEAEASPYTIQWNNISVGVHHVRAVAIDTQMNEISSQTIIVTAQQAQASPLTVDKQIDIDGTSVTGEVTLTNTSRVLKSACIITAVYKDEELKSINVNNVDVQAEDYITVPISVNLQDENYIFRLFVWESLTIMNPLLAQ